MDLKQIHYFTSLFEEGSVTRAARRLNIVQPALSMQIARLEREIGQPLFERGPRGMTPTAAGRLAYRLLLPILRDVAEARQLITDGADEIAGRFSAGLIASVTNSVLPETLAAFTRQSPQVEVSVAEGYSATLTDWVQAGLIDFAIVNRPRRRHDLPSQDVLDEEFVLVTSAAARRRSSPVTFRELGGMKLVLPSKRHGLRSIVDAAAESEDVAIEPQLEVDALPVIEHLVGEAEWATVLPAITLHRGLAAGRLRAQPIVSPRLTRRIVCIHNPRRPISAAGQRFLALVSADLKAAASALALYPAA